MDLYSRSLLIDIIESKILREYSQYYPQSQYNNIYIKYLYRYLRDNTYSGEHNKLYSQLQELKNISSNLSIKEDTDKSNYVLKY